MKIKKMAKFVSLILFFGSSASYGMSKVSDTNELSNALIASVNIASAGKGNVSQVKKLLKKGANPNFKDEKGKTALMYAAESNFFEIVKILLKNGALITIKNNDGDDPLVQAKIMLLIIYSRDVFLADGPDFYADSYKKMEQLLKETLEQRMKTRARKIKEMLRAEDCAMPVKALQDLILEYVPIEEVEGSEENYDLEIKSKGESEKFQSCSACVIG